VEARKPRWTETITYQWARRIAVAVIGGTVVLIGIAMIVLPGPALVVIPLGLGILGLEFAWARRWLARLRKAADGFVNGVKEYNPWGKHRSRGEPPAG
jgi:uncharacterized protein (TIGR02611 family)